MSKQILHIGIDDTDSPKGMCTTFLAYKIINRLKKENVEFFYSKKKEELPTGTCLILVTPDSERTMCTFLGTAGKINKNDVNPDAIKKSEIIFLYYQVLKEVYFFYMFF